MIKFIKLLIVCCLLILAPVCKADKNAVLDSEIMSSYELGPGDKIRISVYREPDLSFDVKLSDAGTITFPFLGEINVTGYSVGMLTEKIAKGLNGRYLIDPVVSISVLEYREFFIQGEVRSPGAFPYFPGLTVRKAISMAGGFAERASQSSVLLNRDKNKTAEPVEVGLDTLVAPGDVVIVEESFF